jgi:ATP synthase protein I
LAGSPLGTCVWPAGNGLQERQLAENEPGLDPLPEDARLNSLDERLKRAKSEEAIRTGAVDTKGDASYRLGNRVLAELIGSMVGGAVIGGTLDWLLGTSPWLLLVLLFLGIGSAFRNIIRISNRRSK